jgi:periplasmic copper chaperone A
MKKLIISTLLSLTATAWAQPIVKVEDAWARGTVATQKASGAFLKLTASSPVRLVEVQSPVAGESEIHEMAMDKDIMVMRAVPSVELPAGRPVTFQPGGYHIMLQDLKQPLKAGESVVLTLTFEDTARQRFTQEVKAVVVPLGAKPPVAAHGGAHRH